MSEPGSDIGIREEDVYALDRQLVAAIIAAAMAGKQGDLFELLEPLHAADIADLLEQVSAEERAQVLALVVYWDHERYVGPGHRACLFLRLKIQSIFANWFHIMLVAI